MREQKIVSLIESVYTWFNGISDPGNKFAECELKKIFTPDFVMELNNKEMTNDYESLYAHFEKFRKSGFVYVVILPLQEIIASCDNTKCIAKYNIIKKDNYNIKEILRVIAIWHIAEDKRLKRMNEVVFFENNGNKHE